MKEASIGFCGQRGAEPGDTVVRDRNAMNRIAEELCAISDVVGDLRRFSLDLRRRLAGSEIDATDVGAGVACPNQRASSSQHFIVGMRRDDRDSLSPGERSSPAARVSC